MTRRKANVHIQKSITTRCGTRQVITMTMMAMTSETEIEDYENETK